MPRTANLLLVAAMFLFLSAGYLTVAIRRLSGSWLVTALLTAQAAAVVALAAVAAANRSWWDLVTAVILAAGSVATWEVHLAARAGRPSRLVRLLVDRVMAKERGGRGLWSLEELRAEYAQGVLDDATRDPQLAAIIDELAGRIVEELTARDGSRVFGLTEVLTAYANGYLDSLSEPGRRPVAPRYRDYSPDMLWIAAVCRAADRLGAR